MKNTLLAISLLLLVAVFGSAQNAPAPAGLAPTPAGNIPDVIVNGFRSYLAGGYSGAISVWTRNSVLAVDPNSYQALTNSLITQANQAGAFTGAEVVRIVNLSLSIEQVYVTVKYQDGALFMGFTCLKQADGKWVITVITADRDPSKVIPTNVMGGL